MCDKIKFLPFKKAKEHYERQYNDVTLLLCNNLK
jgi:hypothetical protein